MIFFTTNRVGDLLTMTCRVDLNQVRLWIECNALPIWAGICLAVIGLAYYNWRD